MVIILIALIKSNSLATNSNRTAQDRCGRAGNEEKGNNQSELALASVPVATNRFLALARTAQFEGTTVCLYGISEFHHRLRSGPVIST